MSLCFYFYVPSCLCLNFVESTQSRHFEGHPFCSVCWGLAHRLSKGFPLIVACSSANLVPMSYNLLAVHFWVWNNHKSFGILHKIQCPSWTRREYQVWKDGCCPANYILRHSGNWACRTGVICVEAAHSFQGGQNPFPSMLNLASTNAFLWQDQTHNFQRRIIRGFFTWISEQLERKPRHCISLMWAFVCEWCESILTSTQGCDSTPSPETCTQGATV